MVIQFSCPACKQPIEVDDPLAGQQVGCPLCQHLVTAPMHSTLADERIAAAPLARPLSERRAVGHPGRTLGILGLSFSLAALLFGLIGVMLSQRFILERFGPNATMEEVMPEIQKEMTTAGPAAGQLMMAALLTMFSPLFWLTGVILSILAARRGDRRAASAGLAFAVIPALLFCLQLMLAR